MKRLLVIAALVFVGMSPAYSQTYSTLPPSVVGQPAVAIHAGRGDSPQVYQYRDAPPPAPVPSSTFVYDSGSGNSYMQLNGPGQTVIIPMQPNSK